MHVLRFDDGLDHVGDIFSIAVGNVEGARDQLLVVALLGGVVGVNQDHVVGQDFAVELIRHQQETHYVVDARVPYEYGSTLVEPHIAVEDEINTGRA